MLKPEGDDPHDLGVPRSQFNDSLGGVRLDIESMAALGRGVGRVSGRVWMVDGAVAGDRVLAVPLREHRSYVEGRAIRVERPSTDRRPVPCPIQARCGGCPWMVLTEEAQRAWKRRIVADCLERLGGFRDAGVAEVLAAGPNLGYRNKVELHFGIVGGRRVLGYHGGEPSRGLVDVERCLLLDDPGNAVLRTAREFLRLGTERAGRRLDGRLVLRRSVSTGRSLVILRTEGEPFPSAEEFAREVSGRHPDVSGVVQVSASPRRRGGSVSTVLAGEGWIGESLGGIEFRVPAQAFFQVNPRAAEHVVRLVLEGAGLEREGAALDLYAGVGVFALALAREGFRVIAVEADREAVESGRRAAVEAGLGARVTFEPPGIVSRRISRASSRGKVDLVVADPPRAGLGPEVTRLLADLEADRIVLVSCDPATLARDTRSLAGRGYALRSVAPVDLFPQTAHVEAVALLERVGPRRIRTEGERRRRTRGGSPQAGSGSD